MKNKETLIEDKLITVCLTAYYSVIYIAGDIAGNSVLGKYLIILSVISIPLVRLFSKDRLTIDICRFEAYTFVFVVFCYISALWSTVPSYAIKMGKNILQLAVAMYIIRLCLPQKNCVKKLLKAWMWGGYIVVVYCLFRYGLNYWINAAADELRIDNEVINANSLGMTAAFSIVISVYLLLYEGIHLDTLFALPALLVVAVAQSRKSILILAFGIAAIMVLKSAGKFLEDKRDLSKLLRAFFRTAVILALFAFFLIQISKLPMFAGMNKRFQYLLNGITGNGDAGGSYDERMMLHEVGIRVFKDNPWLGVGIDNARFYTGQYGVRMLYLHNNYIELLADGGIIGFVVYYWIYIVLLLRFWKYKDFSSGEFCVVSLLLILRLVLDYGCVSYETKSTYYQLLIFYLEAEKLKHLNSTQIHTIPAFWRKGARQ